MEEEEEAVGVDNSRCRVGVEECDASEVPSAMMMMASRRLTGFYRIERRELGNQVKLKS